MSSLRILTYNISWEGQTGTDTRITQGSRCIQADRQNTCTKNVTSLIKDSRADIILLQEATIDTNLLVNSISQEVDIYKWHSSQSGYETMTTIFNSSKLGDPIETRDSEFSPGRPFHFLVFKDYIIVNVHRGHDTNIQNDMQRIIIDPILLQTRKVIIGGDFNMELQSIEFIGKEFNFGNLLQTKKTCCTHDLGKTKQYNFLYDYIAIDEKLRFELLVVPLNISQNLLYSDHLPVFAIVSPIANDIENPMTKIKEKILPKDARLYRGINLGCKTITQPIRNDRNEWFSQYQPTSLIYTKIQPQKPGCLFAFQTTRALRLVNLWSKPTMEFVIGKYSEGYNNRSITDDELTAFKVFSGYGVNKETLQASEVPAIVLAKKKGWVNRTESSINRYITINDQVLPGFERINNATIQWNDLPWGNQLYDFNRTSTFTVDSIVMDTLRDKIFVGLGYDGVYCSPTPSTYHGGIFFEEFILFKGDISSKLLSIGGRNINPISSGGRHRLPFGPTRKVRRSSSSLKKRYSRRQRALRSEKGGYQPTKPGRKV